MTQQNKPLPIGYYLKRADELLTQQINRAQNENQLNRLDWQLMNIVCKNKQATRSEIQQTLKSFADTATIEQALQQLITRELVRAKDLQCFTLTDSGEKIYHQALIRQQAVRQQTMAGISENDYAVTLSVLQKLVENLEADNIAS